MTSVRLVAHPSLNHLRRPANRGGLSGGREPLPRSATGVWRLTTQAITSGKGTGGRPATALWPLCGIAIFSEGKSWYKRAGKQKGQQVWTPATHGDMNVSLRKESSAHVYV